jgi:restriction endonuclease S subunit
MGALGTCNENGICSPAYGVYKPRKDKPYHHRYFDYLYRTPNVITEMTRNSKGIVSSRLRLYPKEFFQIQIALPDYATQKAIVDYLDNKTALIDRKIDLLTQKAVKYDELKQSLINETVTRGLDKTVVMKDSGVDWIGKIPEHWEVKRVKGLLSRNDGGVWGCDPDGISDEILVFRSTEQTLDGRWEIIDPAYRVLSKHERSFYRLLLGDLVITKSSGSSIHIGKTTIVDELIDGMNACYSNFMQRIRFSSKYVAKLAWYLYNCNIVREQLVYSSCSTTGLTNIKGTLINDILVPLPPLPEQQAIADYLDIKTAQIDRIVETINTQIDKLKELRKTLINDVVTGKINVYQGGKERTEGLTATHPTKS